jgi:D-alanyl-D-alanine carboxypeptidase (penicillin-binding protein 5/6)
MRRPPQVVVRPLLGALLAISGLTLAAPAASAAAPPPPADILVDATTGRVLSGSHIHTRLHPASTVKIMTALVGVERLASRAPVTVDAKAAAVEANKIGFTTGTKWPLDQMLAALMMVSANDAAYAIAHTVGGGLDGFAATLNHTARRYGMTDSALGDPAGLDDATSYKGGPYTSAYDLAIATRNALAVPAIAEPAGRSLYEFTDPAGIPHQLKNHNKMLPGGNDGFDYPGITGFKTGFTKRAQHSLVATARRNGRTLIVVILNAGDSGYTRAAALLDAGFAMAPDAKGIGITLPALAVSPYAQRAADRDAFGKLGRVGAAGKGVTVPASIPVEAIAPRAAPIVTTITHHRDSPGMLRTRNIVLVFVFLGVVVVALRRRAVKRRRARRLAQRRQRIAAMRSGGLPVVDGRYRPGTRLGPPVDSHVRVHREPRERQRQYG